jgi:all-trans-retinol dehydrogenase (NAD+)
MILGNKDHVMIVASMFSYLGLPGTVDDAASMAGALASPKGLTCETTYTYKASEVVTIVVHPMWERTGITTLHADRIQKAFGAMREPATVANAMVAQGLKRHGAQLDISESATVASNIRGFPDLL